jgi:hypothetical protein
VNKFTTRMSSFIAILFAMLFVGTSIAQGAAVGGTPQTVAINATVNESLTVTLTGGSITLPMTGALSNTITAAVSWNVLSGHTQGLWSAVWVGSTTSALSGPANVPSSNIAFTGMINSVQKTALPCTGAADTHTGSLAGATCNSENEVPQATLTSFPSGSSTDTYQLAYTGPLITPGTYTGTLSINYIIP